MCGKVTLGCRRECALITIMANALVFTVNVRLKCGRLQALVITELTLVRDLEVNCPLMLTKGRGVGKHFVTFITRVLYLFVHRVYMRTQRTNALARRHKRAN